MNQPSDKIIKRAAAGDRECPSIVSTYLKYYSATLNEYNQDLLKAEKCSIVIRGMNFRMTNIQVEKWNTVLDDMVIKILSSEISNSNQSKSI